MKQIIFVQDGNGGLVAKEINNPGAVDDGSSIQINFQAFKDAMSAEMTYMMGGKLCERVGITSGKGYDNYFYRYRDLVFVNIIDNRYIVLDRAIRNVKIEKILHNSFISFRRKGGDNISRAIPCITMANVMHFTQKNRQEREKTVSESYRVSLTTALWDFYVGNINSLDRHIQTTYDTCKCEGHHEGIVWDNRISGTMKISEEEHKLHHEKHGRGAHTRICHVRNVYELEALYNFLVQNQVRNA